MSELSILWMLMNAGAVAPDGAIIKERLNANVSLLNLLGDYLVQELLGWGLINVVAVHGDDALGLGHAVASALEEHQDHTDPDVWCVPVRKQERILFVANRTMEVCAERTLNQLTLFPRRMDPISFEMSRGDGLVFREATFTFKPEHQKLIAYHRVLVVQDVMTTGKTTRGIIAAVQQAGGKVNEVGVICNLTGLTAQHLGVQKLVSLVTLPARKIQLLHSA